MENLQLLVDFYKNLPRQGPGSAAETLRAAQLAGLDPKKMLRIADIGCGTGASALTLAKAYSAKIVAVDFLQDFLDVLTERAKKQNIDHAIETLCCSMESLPFAENSFDVLWSEGAIYSMGFRAGVRAWKPFLASHGMLVLSEITWLTETRPAALQAYWDANYAEIDVASAKMRVLEEEGYSPQGYFVLPSSCWKDNYYAQIVAATESFLMEQEHSAAAKALVKEQKDEMDMYEKYHSYYGYGVYLARKM